MVLRDAAWCRVVQGGAGWSCVLCNKVDVVVNLNVL